MTPPFPAVIALRRLNSHRLGGDGFARPEEVVRWMGMVQAQDYLAGLWAVGVRMRAATEAAVEQALTERSIVRTWPARGTLHLVAAEDARWLLALMAPRAVARSGGRYRQLGLEEADFARASDALTNALQGGKQLARESMYQVLERAGISTAGQRGIHILGRLAQEGVLCFGTRAGKQQRFTLMDEWLPPTPPIPAREEALARLAHRYISSHGPATLQDFAWWSGLTMAEVRTGVEAAQPHVRAEIISGQTYWLPASAPAAAHPPAAVLLPAFDEYLVGYKNRAAVLDSFHARRVNAGGGMLNPAIVIDGQVMGVWKRSLRKQVVTITPDWFSPPGEAQKRDWVQAAQRYSAFLGMTALMPGEDDEQNR